MQKLWGRKISDLVFTEFIILKHVAKKKRKIIHQPNGPGRDQFEPFLKFQYRSRIFHEK